MRPLAVLLCLFFAACGTRTAVVTPPLPTAPPKAVPVAPAASRIREAIATADKQAASLDTAARESSREATAARLEAERLAAQQSATPEELNSMWKALQSLEARNLFLEREAGKLAVQLTQAGTDAARLQDLASARDAEATDLRAQNDHLRGTAEHYATASATLQRERDAAITKRDRLSGEVIRYRIALGIVIALILVWVAIRFCIPRL